MKVFPGLLMAAVCAASLHTVSASASAAEPAGGHWAAVAAEVAAEVGRVESLAKDGHNAEAKEAAINAYFGLFEERKMEIAERKFLGAAHVAQVENLFNDLRKASGKSRDVSATADALRKVLIEDGQALDAAKVEVP